MGDVTKIAYKGEGGKKNKYVSEADKVPRRMSVKLTKSLHAIEFPG